MCIRDSFGTGYSSLGYLTSFPIDVVKIDRSFVDGVDVDSVKSAIVSAVINLSQAIGSTTVVEGIETASQLEHLRGLGCTTAQGFFFARHGPVEALEDMLISHSVHAASLKAACGPRRVDAVLAAR